MDSLKIIWAGVFNSDIQKKNISISEERTTSLFELEIPIEDGGISYLDATVKGVVHIYVERVIITHHTALGKIKKSARKIVNAAMIVKHVCLNSCDHVSACGTDCACAPKTVFEDRGEEGVVC